MRDRYVKSSELRSFSFCERAWFLERQKVESALEKERAYGAADHLQHGQAVRETTATARAASLLLILGLAGLAAALCFWWMSR